MRSRSLLSRRACSRSQSPIRRCTSGRDIRRAIRPRGKKAAAAARAGSPAAVVATPARPGNCTPASPAHCMAVEARPQPALVLVPAQQSLGLLVDTAPPSAAGVRIRPSAPGQAVARSCSSGTATCPSRAASSPISQPAHLHPHAAPASSAGHELASIQPLLPSRQRTVRHAVAAAPRTTSTPGRPAPPVEPPRSPCGPRSRNDCDASPCLPGSWGCRRSRRRRSRRRTHPPGVGQVEQVQRRSAVWSGRRPPRGPWPSVRRVGIVGPRLAQIEPGGHRPGDRPLGVMTVDRDLTVADLAQRAGVLSCDAYRDGPAWRSRCRRRSARRRPRWAGQQGLDALRLRSSSSQSHGGQQSLESTARRCRGRPGRGCRSSCWDAR